MGVFLEYRSYLAEADITLCLSLVPGSAAKDTVPANRSPQQIPF